MSTQLSCSQQSASSSHRRSDYYYKDVCDVHTKLRHATISLDVWRSGLDCCMLLIIIKKIFCVHGFRILFVFYLEFILLADG